MEWVALALGLLMTGASYWLAGWVSTPPRQRNAPQAPEPLTHPVWGISATIANGGIWGEFGVFPVEVPLDEAVMLASPVGGGPLVLLVPHGPVRRPLGGPLPFTDGWSVWVRAFIPEEALSALYELRDLLPGSSLAGVFTATRWRLRDGELEPLQAWEWPEWGAASLGAGSGAAR